tara:strand:+ start:106 stop:828 length:723 start_codon:yes stop_codon:yes gene_type:complete
MRTEDYLDSTYLKTASEAELSEEDNQMNVIKIIKEAIKYNFKLVMIRPRYIDLAKSLIAEADSKVLVGTVIDFPMGNGTTSQKIEESREAISLGADDLDYVCDYNIFKQKRFEKFDKDIIEGTRLGKENNKTVKWIIETGALSKEEIKNITKRIEELVSNNFPNFEEKVFIKTSTGYYGGFGATLSDVKMMKSVSGNLPIKASGGVSNYMEFTQMLEAGATRIGTSKALSIYLQKSHNEL